MHRPVQTKKMIQPKTRGKEFKSTNNESIQLNYILKQSKKVFMARAAEMKEARQTDVEHNVSKITMSPSRRKSVLFLSRLL